jgi:AhpD family alkylhydroperoxidase
MFSIYSENQGLNSLFIYPYCQLKWCSDTTGRKAMPNPVLSRVTREGMPRDFQEIWDGALRVAGEAAFVEVFANHPAMLRWYEDCFYQRLFNGPDTKVDPRTKELLRLRLSKGHGCHVCNSFNSRSAKAAGFSEAQIDAVTVADPALFDDKDLSIISLAAQFEMDNAAGRLSRELYQRLRKHYDDAQIVELGLIAAMLTGFSKLLFVYDLVTRERVCAIGEPPVAAPSRQERAG